MLVKIRPEDRIIPTYINKDEMYKTMEKTVLIGFPRSGNTALRLFLERYTGRATGRPLIINHKCIGIDTRSSVLFSDAPIPENIFNAFIVKIHKFWEVDLTHNDKIIYILRNYKDCIPSVLRYDNKTFANWYNNWHEHKDVLQVANYGFDTYENFIKNLIDFSYDYGEQLKQFHFITNPRIIVYYEDLVKDFFGIIKNILEFLNLEIDEEKIKKFNVINVEGRNATDKHFYNIGKNNSQINAGCMNFIGEYQGIFRDEELDILRTLFKKQLGARLYNFYLKRYEQ